MNIQRGDIIQLGRHRLLCGDSTDSEQVRKLIEKDKVKIILTDPPYGVDYVSSKKDFTKLGVGEGSRDIQNDQIQDNPTYEEFTRKWLQAVIPYLESYNTYYIFNSDLMFCPLRHAIEQSGMYYSQMIIWIKNNVVVGRKDYLMQHELIAYGWYGRHKMERSKAKSVLFHPKPSRSKLHPTMKPVGLLRKLIFNTSKNDTIVYDPFLGSGSTLIACEQIGRTCLGVEMDAKYCETIIARWEKLTNKKAIKR